MGIVFNSKIDVVENVDFPQLVIVQVMVRKDGKIPKIFGKDPFYVVGMVARKTP